MEGDGRKNDIIIYREKNRKSLVSVLKIHIVFSPSTHPPVVVCVVDAKYAVQHTKYEIIRPPKLSSKIYFVFFFFLYVHLLCR